jgi:nitrogen regulatory protein P-II 1
MKEIKAIIQPFMLSKVINALKEIGGLPGVTVSEVKGFGKSRAANAANKIVEESIEYAKKVKLEIVVPDSLLDQVVNAICAKAHTGRAGDGKIFIHTVDEIVKIRSGEKGEQAI